MQIPDFTKAYASRRRGPDPLRGDRAMRGLCQRFCEDNRFSQKGPLQEHRQVLLQRFEKYLKRLEALLGEKGLELTQCLSAPVNFAPGPARILSPQWVKMRGRRQI